MGRAILLENGGELASGHSSSILRAVGDEDREEEWCQLVEDLTVAARAISVSLRSVQSLNLKRFRIHLGG
jgi:hypothetical protein